VLGFLILMPKLTKKQQAFVAEYLVDMNGTQAAIRAGYSPKTAQPQSARLLSNVMVQAALEKAFQKKVGRIEVTVDNVVEELRRIGFADVRSVAGVTGGSVVAVNSDDWTPEEAAAVAELADTKEGVRIKLHPKLPALESLAKHLGLYRPEALDVNLRSDGAPVQVQIKFDGKPPSGDGKPPSEGDAPAGEGEGGENAAAETEESP